MSPVRIGIFSAKPGQYSTRRLAAAAHERGHDAQVVDYLACAIRIGDGGGDVVWNGVSLSTLAGAVGRIGATGTAHGLSVLRQAAAAGVRVLAAPDAIAVARDKLHTLQALVGSGIAVPRTAVAGRTDDLGEILAEFAGQPVVVKIVDGTQGSGVVFAPSTMAARSAIEAFLGLGERVLVQEFVAEADGADLRCIVLGGEVVAAMRREAAPGDFRSNVHRGGVAVAVEPSEAERRAAVACAAAVGLELAGVDLLRTDRGPVALEVNSSPGLEGIERVTGIDVGGAIIERLVHLVGDTAAATREVTR
jgi:ribosomal protein S6--L-glutamate ligase